MSGFMTHLPVLSVMGCFLGAFLTEIFGKKNKYVRVAISFVFVAFAFVSVALLFKPIMLEGQVLSYWMGNWEPVSGYAIGIGYEIDRFGYFFSMLVVLSMLMSLLYSYSYMAKDKHLDHYYALFLMLSGATLGMVFTGDIFNMFIMIEIITFAAVALTAFREDSKWSLEAAFKYLVIGSMGSGFTLLGIALLYRQCHTLNMAQLASMLKENTTPTTVLALALLFVGLAVESYIVPFHTPAADSYTTAPAPIAQAFSSMVNKAGVYGILRLLYIIFRTMDSQAIQIIVVAFGTITMFVGVTMALSQHDFKRLLAFHSISQVGYIIAAAGLGTVLGVNGALYHAMNHTLFKGLLFLCAGAVFMGAGTYDLDKLGGLSKKMPKTTICFLIGAFSISGLPPFNGFMSKWQIYKAAYEKGIETGNFFYVVVTVVAVIVSVMTLASFIKVTQSVFFGAAPENCQNAKEAPFMMRLPMWIMAILCVATGLGGSLVSQGVLLPAVSSIFNSTEYIDNMMGSGYAAAAGVTQVQVESVSIDYFSPVAWLILFGIVFVAVAIVGITSAGRKFESVPSDDKTATFFGGEKYTHSHVGGSDMFWGFRKNWKGYFDFMGKAHSGIVNDYATWVVVGLVLVIVLMFIFKILV